MKHKWNFPVRSLPQTHNIGEVEHRYILLGAIDSPSGNKTLAIPLQAMAGLCSFGLEICPIHELKMLRHKIPWVRCAGLANKQYLTWQMRTAPVVAAAVFSAAFLKCCSSFSPTY